jgi:hypothetical protein
VGRKGRDRRGKGRKDIKEENEGRQEWKKGKEKGN